jgi:hypothetical protein
VKSTAKGLTLNDTTDRIRSITVARDVSIKLKRQFRKFWLSKVRNNRYLNTALDSTRQQIHLVQEQDNRYLAQ